jgi:hypothetical protein
VGREQLQCTTMVDSASASSVTVKLSYLSLTTDPVAAGSPLPDPEVVAASSPHNTCPLSLFSLSLHARFDESAVVSVWWCWWWWWIGFGRAESVHHESGTPSPPSWWEAAPGVGDSNLVVVGAAATVGWGWRRVLA